MFMILHLYLSIFNGYGEGSVLDEKSDDWNYVISTLNGEVLTPENRNVGAGVYTAQRFDTPGQLWSLRSGCLENKLSKLCLEVESVGLLKMNLKNGELSQKWQFVNSSMILPNMLAMEIDQSSGENMSRLSVQKINGKTSQKWLMRPDGLLKAQNILEKISLESYPLATCNDNTNAVYFRQTESSASNKVLVYLRGGGFCVPRIPGFDCETRCVDEPHLCTATTDPYFDIEDSPLGDNVGSSDPIVNPAFHDFLKIYVPYCSSDVYTGTRDGSIITDNFTFHGHHIFSALIEDLIENTWITTADQVVLMGGSAGAMGTEANCDYFAEELHKRNASIDVRCISDSGSMYPYNTHTAFCSPHLLEYAAYEVWNAISDASCMAEHPDGLHCISASTAYPYVETPTMLLMSSEDTVIRICTEDTPEFWEGWRAELEALARKMISEVPNLGMYIANCPFHEAAFYDPTYGEMEIPLIDGTEGEAGVLKHLIANFLANQHPYQAIDNMSVRNPLCTNK